MRTVLLGEGWRLGWWDGGVRFSEALQWLVTITISDDPLNTTDKLSWPFTHYERHKLWLKEMGLGNRMWGRGYISLLSTGSEERKVLGVGSFPVAILPSCQDMKTVAL